jgi:hypothetical protein
LLILSINIWTSGRIRAETYGFAAQENLKATRQLDFDFQVEFSCGFSA